MCALLCSQSSFLISIYCLSIIVYVSFMLLIYLAINLNCITSEWCNHRLCCTWPSHSKWFLVCVRVTHMHAFPQFSFLINVSFMLLIDLSVVSGAITVFVSHTQGISSGFLFIVFSFMSCLVRCIFKHHSHFITLYL